MPLALELRAIFDGAMPTDRLVEVDAAIFRSRLVDWAPPVISRLKRAAL